MADTASVETQLPSPGIRIIGGSTERERLRTVIAPEPDDIAALVAERISEVIQRAVEERGQCVLGLATGSTPLGIYRELIRRHLAGEVDFSRVVTFNLDEYYPIRSDSLHSYRRFMEENFFQYVNVPSENVHIPDGTVHRAELAGYCEAYEMEIAGAGGIDFLMLGIGRSGHIGFNEPGSSRESRTRLITLDTITRKDAASDFFGETNVPTEAITIGIASILEAREIALIATGEHKATIVRRAVEEEPSADVTASYLQRHPAVTVWFDRAAAAELTRMQTPWVLEEVDWTPAMTERATVWLAERSGKALLKLSPVDYRENPGRLPGEPPQRTARATGTGGRDQRRGVQPPQGQGARKVEAGPGEEACSVLSPPGRRRDLDGRDPPKAVGKRQRDCRGLHDEWQHRRVRPRCTATPRLRGTGRQ